jgi:AraC family transcriptional regulator
MSMVVLRSLPEPGTGAEYLDMSRARTASKDCVIWGRTRRTEFAHYPDTLSVRAAWGGRKHCDVNGRAVAVDDDNFLILNPGTRCSMHIDSVYPVESLTICFRPEAANSLEQSLEHGSEANGPCSGFVENLQPHDTLVSPVLRFIRAHLARGLVDEWWYEEQLIFLLERMQLGRRKLLQHVDSLAFIRPATRREACRRIALATDYLHTHYAREVSLAALARIACLSKFHFLRLFTSIHGVTPHAYLQRKRANVAVRMLQSTRASVSEVAASVGFAFESTLLRQVRRCTQLSPRELRNRAAATLATTA